MSRIKIIDGRTRQVLDEVDKTEFPPSWSKVERIVEVTHGARVTWRAFTGDGQLWQAGTMIRRGSGSS